MLRSVFTVGSGLALTSFLVLSTAQAGSPGELFNHIATWGHSAHDRDWDACVRDRANAANALAAQIKGFDDAVASRAQTIANATVEGQGADQLLARMNAQIENSKIIRTAIPALAEASSRLLVVTQSLDMEMQKTKYDKLDLQLQRETLYNLIPRLPAANRATATILLIQIEAAAASRDSGIIQSVLKLLLAPSNDNVAAVETAWLTNVELTSASIQQLIARKAELSVQMQNLNAESAQLSQQREAARQQLAVVLSNQC